MRCDRCGFDAAPGDRFCRRCGAGVPAAPADPTGYAGVGAREVGRREVGAREVDFAPRTDPADRPTDRLPPVPPVAVSASGPTNRRAPQPFTAARPPALAPHRGRPARDGRPGRRRAAWSVLAIVVVLGLVWGLVFLLGDNRPGSSADGSPTASTGPASTGPATTASRAPSATSSPPRPSTRPSSARPTTSAISPIGRSQAAAVRALVDRSSKARASIAVALTEVSRCTRVDEAAARLSGAAALRRSLDGSLTRQPVGSVPGGAALRSALSTAFAQSAAADEDYTSWARANLGCRVKPRRTQHYVDADGHDRRATVAKRDFVTRWNAIAAAAGQSTLDPGRI